MTRFSSDFRIMPKKQRYRLKCPVKNETCPPTKLSFSKENSCGRCRKSENEAELNVVQDAKLLTIAAKNARATIPKFIAIIVKCQQLLRMEVALGNWKLAG